MHRLVAKLNKRTKIILIALAVLIGLSNTYVPLPIRIEKDLSVPFPCQDKGCGCANAQQCWSSCCCHTDLEKLAWAKRHGVTAPGWFLSQADFTTSTKSDCGTCCCSKKEPQPVAQNDASCCESSSSTCCCSTPPREKPVASCCQKRVTTCCCSAETENASESRPTQMVLMTIKDQHGCQGGDDNWIELELKPVPLNTEPVSYSVPSKMLCCMEPSFFSVWPTAPEPIPE